MGKQVGQLWKKGTRKERISGLTLKRDTEFKQWKFLCGALWWCFWRQYTTASSVCPRGQFWNGQNIGERKVKEENKLKGAWEKRSLTPSYWNNLGRKKSESVLDSGIEPWDLCGDLKMQIIAIAGKGGTSSQSTWGLNWTVRFLAHSLPWVYKCYTLSSRALQN